MLIQENGYILVTITIKSMIIHIELSEVFILNLKNKLLN